MIDSEPEPQSVRAFRAELDREFAQRFPRSKAHLERYGRVLLDNTSHAIRWCEPFVPVVRYAGGSAVGDLDGHRILDYWQGHYANLLGHNPPLVRQGLVETLEAGRGLQSGMRHEVEGEVAELVCRMTGTETVRLTTSGSLGTFYAVVLARAFTGRERVLKVSGGWHGSQPFGLKGVSAHGHSFDHLESEGLSRSTGAEVLLTRFNDVAELGRSFREQGDSIACLLLEPLLGAGGGMAGSTEYLREARALTEQHGALLLCDEIITGFRFRAGDLSALHGVRPDLLILGKILGGGMPVAAVAGRRDVLELATRGSGRVKFEGGTYSAHELSLVAARTMLTHLGAHEQETYSALGAAGEQMRAGLARIAAEEAVPVAVLGGLAGVPTGGGHGSSLAFLHVLREGAATPSCPEELAERAHPLVGERLLRSVLMLEDVSVRSGLGAISAAHSPQEIERTLESFRDAFRRLRRAGLV